MRVALAVQGWLHHLARHAVACFLTRGDLYQSWTEGARVFDVLLLDADWALNNANWMWLSASAFFHQYFRVYSPVAFGKATDPTGAYIRKYLPALARMPDKCVLACGSRGGGRGLSQHSRRCAVPRTWVWVCEFCVRRGCSS